MPLKFEIFNFRPKKCQIPNLHQFGSYKKPYEHKKLEEKKLVILGPRGHYVRPPGPVAQAKKILYLNPYKTANSAKSLFSY
jgi:hypothetical protein